MKPENTGFNLRPSFRDVIITFVTVTSSSKSTIHQTGVFWWVTQQLPAPKLLSLFPSTAFPGTAGENLVVNRIRN